MTYLPPYRHELRGAVKPFIDVLTDRNKCRAGKEFKTILDELESLIREEAVPREKPKKVYLDTIETCRNNPGSVTNKEVAKAIAAATVATQTDILGILYQHTGRTAERYFNQYFTPPNAAASVAIFGETARDHFTPPSPSADTVSGETTLSMFENDSDSRGSAESAEKHHTVYFDPACGSGRLLLAAGRRSSTQPICLGWDIERDTARMAALTLAIAKIPGWIVAGDALQLTTTEVYRIAPNSDYSLQCFRSFSSRGVPDITDSHLPGEESYNPLPELQESVPTAAEAIDEINQVLESGVDQTVGNPPFSKCDLGETHSAGNRSYTDYDLAYNPIGAENGTLQSSQKCEWLFTELALEFTKPEGDVSLILPTSMLANPSEVDEREWLLDAAYYEAGGQLPPETFAPETTTGTTIVSLVPKTADNFGLQIDHEIFMGIAETVGHDTQASKKELLNDGEPVELETETLPAYFTTHRWRGIERVQAPDDDLVALSSNHREMRADDGTDTTPLGRYAPTSSEPTNTDAAKILDSGQLETAEESIQS